MAAVAVLAIAGEQIDVNDALCEWMQEEIDAGVAAVEAGRVVLEKLRSEGLLDAALDRWGGSWVAYVWRLNRVNSGRSHIWDGSHTPEPAAPSGGRRVDLRLLKDEKSALETLWFVDDQWIRLGDLVKHQCRTLADKYMQLVENAQRKAAFFDKLATDLPKDKTVRGHFGEDRLRGMLAESGA